MCIIYKQRFPWEEGEGELFYSVKTAEHKIGVGNILNTKLDNLVYIPIYGNSTTDDLENFVNSSRHTE